MAFYIYYHWHHKPTHALIHRGSCFFCNEGKGWRTDKTNGLRGEWSNRFTTYHNAEEEANKQDYDRIEACQKCDPSNSSRD